MARLLINSERMLDDLKYLAAIGMESGVRSRVAFSPAFEQASAWIVERMTAAGLAVSRDAAGNVVGRTPGGGRALAIASHIDTVPGGGWLDGAYGVIAGLECARAAADCGARQPIEVIAFADEEGAYVSMLGSRAFSGLLTAEEIESCRPCACLLPMMEGSHL